MDSMVINENTGNFIYHGINYLNIDYVGDTGQTCTSQKAEVPNGITYQKPLTIYAGYKKEFSDRGCTIYDASQGITKIKGYTKKWPAFKGTKNKV
jgi:hypothetical protein